MEIIQQNSDILQSPIDCVLLCCNSKVIEILVVCRFYFAFIDILVDFDIDQCLFDSFMEIK